MFGCSDGGGDEWLLFLFLLCLFVWVLFGSCLFVCLF